MLQIAICDDEEFYRKKVGALLTEYCQEHSLPHNIMLFPSGLAFLSAGENAVKYDIVFMDINMEELNGVETALCLRNFHSRTQIVFVTAFINYALEGYKADAVRYIMKDTLDTAIPECMDAILKKMQLQQVAFSFLEGQKTLYTDNILYIESRRHKSVFFYLDSELVNYQIYEKLDNIEHLLTGYGFLRIHKSYLVNMKHIRKISNYAATLDFHPGISTGRPQMLLQQELPVPRLRYQAVREAFVTYKGAL